MLTSRCWLSAGIVVGLTDYLFGTLDILENRAVVYAAQSGRKFFRVTQPLQ